MQIVCQIRNVVLNIFYYIDTSTVCDIDDYERTAVRPCCCVKIFYIIIFFTLYENVRLF